MTRPMLMILLVVLALTLASLACDTTLWPHFPTSTPHARVTPDYSVTEAPSPIPPQSTKAPRR